MSEAQPQRDSWPASDPQARRAVAPIVARAFAWSPAVAALASMGTVLAALGLGVLAWLDLGSWWALLWAPVYGYPLTVLSFYISARLVITDPGKTWWLLADHRGKGVVMTVVKDGGTYAYYLAAQPKNQGLGYDLMRWVTEELDTAITGHAWRQTAERYTRWGAFSHGRRPWRLTHCVEFRPRRSLSRIDPEGE